MKKIDKDSKEAKKLYNRNADSYFKYQRAYPVHNQTLSIINNLIEKPKGKKILYAGCGDANEAVESIRRGADVFGIDISERCIELASKRFGNAKFFVMDLEQMDFPNSYFDYVVCIFAVMYKEDMLSVFREFRRVVKDGGEVIIAVPHPIRKMIKYNNMDYFVSGRKTEIWNGNERFGYRRSMEEYINTFIASGLTLRGLYEPKPPIENTHPHHLIFHGVK